MAELKKKWIAAVDFFQWDEGQVVSIPASQYVADAEPKLCGTTFNNFDCVLNDTET
jgi:hypothetical protein